MRFLVAGTVNIETTLGIEGFPIPYFPVRYAFNQVDATVSGVGYNLTRALTTLGRRPALRTLVGNDVAADLVDAACRADGLPDVVLSRALTATPQSVILYDRDGRRQINVDLKDVQETALPPEVMAPALKACDIAVLCNVNFTRPYLAQARALGKIVATDVHTIGDLDDPYNADYMAAADILFMSDEALPVPPAAWLRQLWQVHGTPLAVIGLGANGALLGERATGTLTHVPAVAPRPIVNTIGAGDALFAAFLHGYADGLTPVAALRQAVVFAGWKIGANGAARGFLDAARLARLTAAA